MHWYHAMHPKTIGPFVPFLFHRYAADLLPRKTLEPPKWSPSESSSVRSGRWDVPYVGGACEKCQKENTPHFENHFSPKNIKSAIKLERQMYFCDFILCSFKRWLPRDLPNRGWGRSRSRSTPKTPLVLRKLRQRSRDRVAAVLWDRCLCVEDDFCKTAWLFVYVCYIYIYYLYLERERAI